METAIRKYLARIGSEGGKSGTGASKRRTTTFTPELAKAASQKRWGNTKKRRVKNLS